MRNLPPHLTDSALRTQLQPFMNRLSIADYMVEKQRNKKTGNVTFLHIADGTKFLQHHGEEPVLPATNAHTFHPRHKHPPTRARLSLLGSHVYCKVSNRGADEFALKTIQHQASLKVNDEAPSEPTKTLEATELNCGYHTFNDGRLTFTAEWSAKEVCLVKFSKRSLRITLARRRVQLRMPFQSIVELVWWQDGNAAVTLSWAPTILSLQTQIDELAALFSVLGIGQAGGRGQPEQSQRLDAIDEAHGRISPFCLVYHFNVRNPVTRHINNEPLQSEMVRIRKKQLCSVTRYDFGFRHAGGVRFGEAAANLRSQLSHYYSKDSLPFGLLFLLQALMANSYLHPTTISALAQRLVERFTEAKKAGNDEPPVSVDAFKKLFDWIDYPMPDGDPTMFEVDGIMAYLEKAERLVRESPALRATLFGKTQSRARIFRATVTPTRVLLQGPELEPMNRVLRKFSDHSYFIRAQFCDENGQDLFFNAKVSLDSVHARFKSVLSNGVQVAGRIYKLLGFSHSSLRAHSAWLSAPFIHQGQPHFPDFIITGLGDFNQIKSPARRAARIGQAFSETPYALDLDENKVEVLEIPDIKRNDRVFSDGVGTISPGAADAV